MYVHIISKENKEHIPTRSLIKVKADVQSKKIVQCGNHLVINIRVAYHGEKIKDNTVGNLKINYLNNKS